MPDAGCGWFGPHRIEGAIGILKTGLRMSRAGVVLWCAVWWFCAPGGSACGETHFPPPMANNLSCDFFGSLTVNEVPAQPGDEVAFFDGGGVLCGRYVIDMKGQYGRVHVYGDDPTTPDVDEGAVSGEELSVRVWDASLLREAAGASVTLEPGEPAGSAVASQIPPVWQSMADSVLNIDAVIPVRGDVNGDFAVDLADAVLALRVVSGRYEPLLMRPRGGCERRSTDRSRRDHVYPAGGGGNEERLRGIANFDLPARSEAGTVLYGGDVMGTQVRSSCRVSIGSWWSIRTLIWIVSLTVCAAAGGAAYASGVAGATHFETPVSSPFSCDFMGTVLIDGAPAEVGDEVAFFDPAGVLCGLFVVDTAGEYGIVHVYGDDTATPGVDEGASPGDELTVKVWDSTAEKELADALLVLSAGVPPAGSSFESSSVPPVWQDNTGYVLNIDTPTHFEAPTPTPHVCNYLGEVVMLGQPAPVGTEIAVLDPDGTVCGLARITVPGQYGVVQVYGDDTATQEDEGAEEGDELVFKVWDKGLEIEYSGANLILHEGTPAGSFVASSVPPEWNEDAGYALDLIVHGRETVTVPAGTFDCLKVEPIIQGEGLFQFEGDIMIWLTDDERRMPVLMKTNIKIGAVDAALYQYQEGAAPPRASAP